MNAPGSALITGGGSGIGKHLSLVLAKRGCRLTVRHLTVPYRKLARAEYACSNVQLDIEAAVGC